MAFTFEFEVGKSFHFSNSFAKRLNTTASKNRVSLPAKLGEGFIQEVFLDNGISLCLHNYMLKQDLILRRKTSGTSEIVAMKFDCRRLSIKSNKRPQKSLFTDGKDVEVEFGSGNFFTELKVPKDIAVLLLVVTTSREDLMNLVRPDDDDDQTMIRLLNDTSSFVFQEQMTQEMEHTLIQLGQINQSTRLPGLLYQVKAMDLIYALFTKLLNREANHVGSINPADAEKIYKIRERILTDLSVKPRLPKLASHAGMSMSKMKTLFQQIYGKSIYNYYQTARMRMAAQLLRELSVSDTGHKVGFTNLSHFTKLFEKHHHMKPKRFKNTLSQ